MVSPAAGETIVLSPGQSFSSGTDTIICSEDGSAVPIELKQCQFWDEFNKKCLFESTRYVQQGMECLEQCQHWDDFYSRCDYATSCRYLPDQGVFLETSCSEFDDFSKKCLREKEKILRRGRAGKKNDEGH